MPASAPHCLYGFCPTLFDAPSRDTHDPLDWIAHSFLVPIELFNDKREVRPVLGFSWGFDIDTRGIISLKPTEVLSAADWERHLDYLSARSPSWTFACW